MNETTELSLFTAQESRFNGFKKLIEKFGYKNFIELGVREGYFAKFLLSETPLEVVFGVDIKKHHELDERLKLWNFKYTFCEQDAIAIANLFPDESWDVVHVDDDHHEEHVFSELNTWWPKVKVGGLLSGDDFFTWTCTQEGKFGVIEGVYRFLKHRKEQGETLQLQVIGIPYVDEENLRKYGMWVQKQQILKITGNHFEPYCIPNFYIRKEKHINT